MKVPVDLKYTESHEWVKVTDDGSSWVTEYAQGNGRSLFWPICPR